MNNDIIIAIENLARAVEDEDSTIRVWAMATVAIRLGMTAVLTTEEEPVASMVEVGQMWTDSVEQQLEDDPERTGDTLRAAHCVVMGLLEAVDCGVLAA